MKVGGYPTPCETFERGGVEDYSVIIMDVPTSAQSLIVGYEIWFCQYNYN